MSGRTSPAILLAASDLIFRLCESGTGFTLTFLSTVSYLVESKLTFIVRLNGFNTIFSRGICYKRITRGKYIGLIPVLCKPIKYIYLTRNNYLTINYGI